MKDAHFPLWQTPEWEQFQKSLGHKTTRIDRFLMLKFPLFAGMRYGYIPRGPVFLNDEKSDEFFNDLLHYAKKKKFVFVRMDPEKTIPIPKKIPWRKSHSPQPETTLILNLDLSEEDLLKQMKRKGRYNINLAEKKGVIVKRAQNLEEQKEYGSIFFRLLKETTQRDAFTGHDEHYYQSMLKELPMSEIFLAFYNETPVSGAICTFQSEKAIYYYGASSSQYREVMAPYLLQWEAIKEAKKRGCKEYDFLGIAPEDAGPEHPWKGITEFKSKFGGTVVHYPPAQDLIFRPFWYKMYRLMKRIQKMIK
jgi:lipid II:glycine glycyltransferase (peptidoglycan interpeptide bridge formation enzyme)